MKFNELNLKEESKIKNSYSAVGETKLVEFNNDIIFLAGYKEVISNKDYLDTNSRFSIFEFFLLEKTVKQYLVNIMCKNSIIGIKIILSYSAKCSKKEEFSYYYG